MAADVGTGSQVKVLALQSDEFGDPQSGFDGDKEQGMVAPADPAGTVGAGQQCLDLLFGQKLDHGTVGVLGWDGQDSLDQSGVIRVVQRRETEQRVDGGEAGVSGANGVGPLGLQVVQEGADECSVEVLELQQGALWVRPEAKFNSRRKVSL